MGRGEGRKRKRGKGNMAALITTPGGEQVKIDGNKVWRSSSPEVWEELAPGFIVTLIDYAWHQGWEVDVEGPGCEAEGANKEPEKLS